MTTILSVNLFPVKVAQATDEDISRDLAHIGTMIEGATSDAQRHFYEAAEILLLEEQYKRLGCPQFSLAFLVGQPGGVQ